MIHHETCPLCNSETIGLWLQTNDFFLSSEPFSLFRCSSCGFVFTQEHPDENSAGNYYASEDYISHNDSAKGFINSVYRLSRSIMLRKKRNLVTRLTGLKEGELLDIGSGTGHFLAEMKKSGWNTRGVEINDKARLYAINSLGLDVTSPQKITLLPDRNFDCITLWHVLEHFHDLYGYALEMKRLLKPDGICVIALPNCISYDAKHYKKFWAAFDVPRHLWHFSPASFSYFTRKSGFNVIDIRNLPLDIFYISILSEKYKGVKFSFLKGVIKGMWFFTGCLFNRNRSSSLIYILKRR